MKLLLPLVVLFAFLLPSFAQEAEESRLLPVADLDGAVSSGQWSQEDGELRSGAGEAALLTFPQLIPQNYDLEVEFTRVEGTDSIVFVVPVGDVSPALEISGWEGESHGLSRVNGLSTNDPGNPISVRPGTIENGRRYLLEVSVRVNGENASIQALLGGDGLFTWEGVISSLMPNLVIQVEQPNRLGLSTR
ncbi:MAG: hypothetical protein AAGC68_17085, partial [Verrucomicrobiota bacterium]